MPNRRAARSTFVEVALPSPLAAGQATTVAIPAATIALFNVDGRVFGIADACVRCGDSLSSGTLRGAVVTCAGCGWQYDVTTGCVNGVPALKTDTFKVKVVGPQVVLASVKRERATSS